MPRDLTRVTYDENGGMVTEIPKGTPKDEIKEAREEGRVDKNDPAYNSEDAAKDAERQEEIVDAGNEARTEAIEDAQQETLDDVKVDKKKEDKKKKK